MREERPRKGGRSLRAGERKEWSGLGRRGGTGLRFLGPGQGCCVGLLLGWVLVELGLVLDLLLFSNSSSFSKANTQILFGFKYQFEFKPTNQTKRTMHQHECNIKFLNLDKF